MSESTSPGMEKKSGSENTIEGAELKEPEVAGKCGEQLQSQPSSWK